MNELTPEAQAVLDAAIAVPYHLRTAPLADAVARYHKSIAPPEPFTRYMCRYGDGGFGGAAYLEPGGPLQIDEVWEVQITPVRKVR